MLQCFHNCGKILPAARHIGVVGAEAGSRRARMRWWRVRLPTADQVIASASHAPHWQSTRAARGLRRTLGAANPGEGGGGEDHLHRYLEVFGDPQRQVQAGAVLAPLQVADRLVVDPEGLRELPTRDTPLRAQHGDAVVDGFAHRSSSSQPMRWSARWRRACMLAPDSLRAMRRSTTGARTRPTSAHAPSTPTVSRCRHDAAISTEAAEFGRKAERTPSPSQEIGNTWAIACTHPGS